MREAETLVAGQELQANMRNVMSSISMRKWGRWILNLAIVVYFLLVLITVFTNGFNINVLGLNVRARHPEKPAVILLFLLFTRYLITLEKKNAVLLLCSIPFAAGLGESFLRIVDFPIASQPELKNIHRPSISLGYELVPLLEGRDQLGHVIKINAHGLRDHEHTWLKPKGTCRILGLGDSFTFGMSVELKDTYLKRLEQQLRSYHQSTEVINAGVIGYNLWQYVTYLKEKGVNYEPDLVTLGFFQDDIRGDYIKKVTESDFDPDSSYHFGRNFYLYNFFVNSYTVLKTKYRYLIGSDWLKSISERRKYWGPENKGNQNYENMSGAVDPAVYERVEERLREIKEIATSIQAQLLIVLIPDSVQLGDPAMQEINRILYDICLRNNIHFLDMTKEFERREDISKLYLFPVDAHTSRFGNEVIARAMLDKIKGERLLPCFYATEAI